MELSDIPKNNVQVQDGSQGVKAELQYLQLISNLILKKSRILGLIWFN